jgi:hypothetical protein
LHVPGGAFIHSAIGLLPHGYILILEGGILLLALVTRRRAALNQGAADARALLVTGGVVAFAALAAVTFGTQQLRTWDAARQPRIALAAHLDQRAIAADDRLFGLDAASLNYWTARPAVVTPNDPLDTIEAVARAYEVRWLVLERGRTDRDRPVPALASILRGESRPEWIGPRAFAVPSLDGGPPLLALHPVCVQAGDTRCSS